MVAMIATGVSWGATALPRRSPKTALTRREIAVPSSIIETPRDTKEANSPLNMSDAYESSKRTVRMPAVTPAVREAAAREAIGIHLTHELVATINEVCVTKPSSMIAHSVR
jgi:hypothetical protein